MSDVSQGPGWWEASDGKWYPPEQAPQQAAPTGPPPGYGPPGAVPGYGPPPGYGAPGAVPGYGAPAVAGPNGTPGQLVEWPQRVIATLVDSAFLVAGYIVIIIVTAVLSAVSDALGVLFALIGWAVMTAAGLYFAYLTGERGQSPGKQIIGIKVISEETGQPIGGGMGVVRQFAHILDGFCLIGYLFPLWDPKKQTFADKIIKTVVVPGEKKSFGPEIFKP